MPGLRVCCTAQKTLDSELFWPIFTVILQCNKIFVDNNGPGGFPVAGPGTVRAKRNPQEWNEMAS
ncbi:MAG: hypothetical protein OEU56_08680, partial [Rhodospirillales bacterium]|nr:hypothetical protein [Rhodospirillales bacterium]